MIISITNQEKEYGCTIWKMYISLSAICECSGKRFKDKYNNISYVEYPLPRAKKVLKLVAEYADEKTLIDTELYLKGHNKKLYDYFMKQKDPRPV